MAGYLVIAPLKFLSTRMWMWMWMWRLCQGRPVFACLHVYQGDTRLPSTPSECHSHSHSPLPPFTPASTLVLVYSWSRSGTFHLCSFACDPPIRCTFLRALDARGPKDRVRDNTLLSLVQPPLFPATFGLPLGQPNLPTTATTSTQNIPHPLGPTQSPSWSEPAQHIR
jgi:hypothetical protein